MFYLGTAITAVDVKIEKNDKIEIIKTNRGRECVLHDGYRYYFKQQHKKEDLRVWRCVNSRYKTCNSSMVTKGDRIVTVRNHTCVQNHIENEKLKIFNRCVTECDPSGMSVADLHKKIVKEFRNSCLDVNGEVPTKAQIKEKLRSCKKKLNK